MQPTLRIFAGLCACAMLVSSCTAIPVSSLWSLSRIDFSTTDIAALRVAVELPNGIEARDGGVHMDIGYALGDKKEKLVFLLQEDRTQVGQRGLLPFPAEGKHIRAYRLRDQDAAKLEQIRLNTLAKKQAGQKGSLEIGISAKEFCKEGDLQPAQAEVTTFVATSETKGYVVLLKDFDLTSDAATAEALKKMPLCNE